MKDKEKQIEEMFNYLRECSNNAWAKGFDYAEIDNEKLRSFLALLPEDSVVLSRGEYEKLTTPRLFIKPRELNQKELAEKLKNEKYGIIGVDESIIEIIPTRQEIEKEMAEKFAREVLKLFPKDKQFTTISRATIYEIALKKGVEIKE